MNSKRQLLLIGAVCALVAIGALLRNPLKRIVMHGKQRHAPSTGRFHNPEGLAFDSLGNLYVANQDDGEFMILDKNGKLLKQFGEIEGYHDGQGRPSRFCRGLYVRVPEPFHVFTTGNHNGLEFDASGDKPKLIRIFGSQGGDPGQVDGPEGIWRDVNGDVYMTSEHYRRIVVFDKDGKHLRSWDVPQDPQSLMVLKDRVYVSLDKRNYLACYTKDGVEQFRIGHAAAFPYILYVTIPAALLSLVTFIAMKKPKVAWLLFLGFLAAAGAGSAWDDWRHDQPGEFRLCDDILVSPDGTELFIADRHNNRIQVTDLDGHFKRMFSGPGSKPGELNDPKQLAFDADGNLWVCDSDNHRLSCFSRDGKFLRLLE
jgi:sugar lactone lactonase YvrE